MCEVLAIVQENESHAQMRRGIVVNVTEIFGVMVRRTIPYLYPCGGPGPVV